MPPTDDSTARADTPPRVNGSTANAGRNGTNAPGERRTTNGTNSPAGERRKSTSGGGTGDRRKTNATNSAAAERRKSTSGGGTGDRRTTNRRRDATSLGPTTAASVVAPDDVLENAAPETDERVPIFDAPFVPPSDHAGNGRSNGSVAIPQIVPAEPQPEVQPEVEADADADAGLDVEVRGPSALLLPPMPLPDIVPAEPITDLPTTDLPTTDLPISSDTALEPTVLAPAEFTDTDGTGGLPSLLKPKKPPRALRAPLRQHRRPRVRKVTRVVRHVDTWSVFKVAFVFSVFTYGVLLTAGVLLWQVAQNTGTVDNIERFFESFGWQSFELKGGEIYHNAWIAGLFLVVGLTGFMVLAATLFNLITDLVGGIRVTVLEEEVVAREDRGTGWRRARRGVPLIEKLTPPPVPAADPNPVE